MFKLVVLFALVAAAVGEPGAILNGAYLNGALPYAAPYLAPASPYYGQAGYIPSNYFYSSPYLSAPAHFIKKRSADPEPSPSPSPSAPLFAYASSYYPNTYLASAPLATSYSYSSSLLPGAPVLPLTYTAPATAHFIKKRSASPSASPAASPAASPSASPSVAFPSTYIAPAAYPYAAASPLLTTSYSYGAAPYYASSPYFYGSGPFAYSTFIKK